MEEGAAQPLGPSIPTGSVALVAERRVHYNDDCGHWELTPILGAWGQGLNGRAGAESVSFRHEKSFGGGGLRRAASGAKSVFRPKQTSGALVGGACGIHTLERSIVERELLAWRDVARRN